MKNWLSRKFRNLHFLSSADATYILNFTPRIIYREAQHFLRTSALICYPRKWNKIENRTDGRPPKIDICTLSAPIGGKPLRRRFARTPYYSSSWGLEILLYESLKSILIWISIDFWSIWFKINEKLTFTKISKFALFELRGCNLNPQFHPTNNL